jgi:PAS domain S-box-containing protein
MIENNIFQKILRIGFNPHFSGLENNRLITLNAISIISLLLSIGFIAIFSLLNVGNWFHIIISIPVFSTVLFLNHFQKHELAKFTFFFGSLAILLFWVFAYPDTGNEYGLIALACSSGLLFDSRPKAIGAFILCGLTYFSNKIYFHFVPFTKDETINYFLLQNTLMLVYGGLVFFLIMMYHRMTRYYHQRIKVKNTTLNYIIKQKRNVEQELKESNDELKALSRQLDWIVLQKTKELKSYTDAIDVHVMSSLIDVHGNMLKVNKPFSDVSGYETFELVGKNISLLSLGNHNASFFSDLWETVRAGKMWRGELKNKSKDGSSFWTDTVIMPLREETGKVIYFLTISLPITDRKVAEEQRYRTSRILESIAFQTSHDIRRPITTIMGLANLVMSDMLKEDELKYIASKFYESAMELDKATTDLSDFVYQHEDEFMHELTKAVHA